MSDNLNRWLSLEPNQGLVGEQLLPENKHFTIQRNGFDQFTLLGDFNKETPFKNLPAIKGINISQISQQNHNILMLSLENKDQLRTFNTFALFLAENTKNLSGEDLAKATLRIIKEWSEMFSKQKKGMSESEIIGLVCELHALKNHLLEIYDPDYSVKAWLGPEGSKQDFACDKFVFDVKGHMVGREDLIHISSVEQLDVEIRVPFFILKVDLLPSSDGNSSNTLSINSLTKAIIDSLQSNHETKMLFESKLNEIIYHATKDDLDNAFILDKEFLYVVDDAFPKIKRIELSEAIEKVEYSLNASKLSSFICDRELKDYLKDV